MCRVEPPKRKVWSDRWRRWLGNERVRVNRIYLPLVMAALSGWSQQRLYIVSRLAMIMLAQR